MLFLKQDWARRRRRMDRRARQSFGHSNQGREQCVHGILGGDGAVHVIELKLARDFHDDVGWHRLDIVHIGINQRVFTEQVNDARDTPRIEVHGADGLGRKDRFAIAARDVQARLNIVVSLLESKSGGFAAKRNPLLDLAQLRSFEALFELRLPREHDLQKLLAWGLQIQQHANLFQHMGRQSLGFVHDHHRRLARAIAVQQPQVQAHEHATFQSRVEGHSKIRQNEIEQMADL
jgi:hypothetical protein